METASLKAEARDGVGTRVARRQRKQGLVPAVILRKREAPIHLLVPARELEKALQRGARLVDLSHPQGTDKVFIKEVQYDHLGERLYHVDFAMIAMDEKLTLEVRLVLKGKPVGVTEEGGVLDQYLQTIGIECLPTAIPQLIEADVSHLKKDQHLTIADLRPPEGVRLVQDPGLVVASVTEHKVEEVAPVAVTPGPVEPELIKKEKAEEEAAEGEKTEKTEKTEKKETAPKKEEKK